MKQREQHPPGWATKILRWYCKPSLLEDLEGDLNEFFQRNVKSDGIRKAKLIYIIDVFKFFRLYTIRKPEFINLLINFIMIGSYIKTSGRSIARNKLFSTINIVGLAISMSVGLLMISFVHDILSYDDFHEKKDRIYRVNTEHYYLNEPVINLASTSVKAGKKIQEETAGTEAATLLRRSFNGDAGVGENFIPISGLWADQSFFKVFTFPLLQGDPATALKEPYSLVLTEQSAKKLFGLIDPLGKSVKFDSLTYVVTGVMKDVPKLSHMRFEALVSFATAELQLPKQDPNYLSWDNVWMNYVYVVLPEKTTAASFSAELGRISAAENKLQKNTKDNLVLQPLKSIVVGPDLHNQIGNNLPLVAIYVLIGLSAVVILSACFNYTNLSIARSMRRSREVGIRKVIGAQKGNVRMQFLSESILISLLALSVAFALFLLLRNQFLSLHPFIIDFVSLDLSSKVVLYFILLAVGVGITAGFLPAMFFSKINALSVLKDVSTLQLFRHVSFRKALVVVQYTCSLIFITITVIGFNQYKAFLSFDLGFTTDNILNIRLQGNKADLLAHELSQIPSISGMSKSMMVNGLGNIHATQLRYNNAQDSAGVWINLVDENYLPLHNYELLAGTNFKLKPKVGSESEVIVNEQLLKRFNIANQNPAKALGEVVEVDRKKLTIVGVMKDFHYGSVEKKIEPVAFTYYHDENGYLGFINAKISSTDYPATLASINAAWKKVDKVHALDAKFYNNQIEQHYSQFSIMLKIIGFLSFLAVCISSMGLFGMVVFTTETKLKEISIRKVMGANEVSLIYLLGKNFLLLLAIAAIIALPLTYLFFDKIVLTQVAYHKAIEWSELLVGSLGVLIIAVLMIGSQTLKVARTNPAEVLKNE